MGKDIGRTYRVLGVMSGSSMDGIDLAVCAFREEAEIWKHEVILARTAQFSSEMEQQLEAAMDGTAIDLARLHTHLGRAIGSACADVLREQPAELIASHGHTIFHRPAEGLTFQAGSGSHIAALAGVPVVCDFRTLDMAHGGQGAPLVPLGEKALFPGHIAFLNLGGIANLSVHGTERVTGFDICPCNQLLDGLARESGERYDAEGRIARAGAVNGALLARLNGLAFYAQAPPRSLGREWYTETMRPLMQNSALALPDRMATAVAHIAEQILRSAKENDANRILATGGGVHNTSLMDQLRSNPTVRIEVPSKELVDMKEAVIFAFLGLMRFLGRVNTLASVTGAGRDTSGGAIYWPY
ncbi:MAG: anhydro-N-acetylmuramic acid kinase [Flavobacteriales bacterium]|nr:anhydro-N-acetylmuramic acid kinase [Flavobacteriales bacterium]